MCISIEQMMCNQSEEKKKKKKIEDKNKNLKHTPNEDSPPYTEWWKYKSNQIMEWKLVSKRNTAKIYAKNGISCHIKICIFSFIFLSSTSFTNANEILITCSACSTIFRQLFCGPTKVLWQNNNRTKDILIGCLQFLFTPSPKYKHAKQIANVINVEIQQETIFVCFFLLNLLIFLYVCEE